MTGMGFPYGDASRLISSMLADWRFEARVNHRGQYYYQARTWWRGRPVLCRLGLPGLSRLPDSLFAEAWCGLYDAAEPDSMLFDMVCANIFACLEQAGFGPGAPQTPSGSSRVKVVPWAEEVKSISPW